MSTQATHNGSAITENNYDWQRSWNCHTHWSDRLVETLPRYRVFERNDTGQRFGVHESLFDAVHLVVGVIRANEVERNKELETDAA